MTNPFVILECNILAWRLKHLTKPEIREAFTARLTASYNKTTGRENGNQMQFDEITPDILYKHFTEVRTARINQWRTRWHEFRLERLSEKVEAKIYKLLPSWERSRIQMERDLTAREKQGWKNSWLNKSSDLLGLEYPGTQSSLVRVVFSMVLATVIASMSYFMITNFSSFINWISTWIITQMALSGLPFLKALGSLGVALILLFYLTIMISMEIFVFPTRPNYTDMIIEMDHEIQDRLSEIAYAIEQITEDEDE
jgi:hypothetical protein